MKIFHTGDWHLGKIINEYSMLEEQKYVLNQFFQMIEKEKPDVIIIAGDIYDRSIPPKEAVELLDDILTKLIEFYHIPTLVIAGNHDSQERLSFGNRLLEHKHLYIQGTISSPIKEITLSDDEGLVHFYLIPYAHPIYIRNLYQDESIQDHQDAFKAMLTEVKKTMDPKERNVLITHNYVLSQGDEVMVSDSERSLSIGGAEFVDVSLVEDFDYVAIGHLHQAQKVKYDYIRYSGSLLKYSFSEIKSPKGILCVDLHKTSKNIHFIPFKPLHEMREIKGTLEELTSKTFYERMNCEDYIRAILTDTSDVYNPIETLRAIYPNIMQIQRNQQLTEIESRTKAKSNFKNRSKRELFSEFYEQLTGEVLDEEKLTVLDKVENKVLRRGLNEN